MATYAFLDDGRDINDDPMLRNDLLLDLNHGGANGNVFEDPAGFVSRVETMSVIYGVSLPTPSRVVTRTGPGGWIIPLTADVFGVARPTKDGEIRFKDIETPNNGERCSRCSRRSCCSRRIPTEPEALSATVKGHRP